MEPTFRPPAPTRALLVSLLLLSLAGGAAKWATAAAAAAAAASEVQQELASGPSANADHRRQHQHKHQHSQDAGHSADRDSHQHQHRRPSSSSSSSMFSELEDLFDSSVHMRVRSVALGQELNGPVASISHPLINVTASLIRGAATTGAAAAAAAAAPRPPIDFGQLIDRLLATPATDLGHALAPDPQPGATNNKTSMRFFRNNKTFASVVFTNEPWPKRRLINCHLVDLEKHAPDVVIFESKYGIGTLDIEFEDMMSLIESCTDIARFRPFRLASASAGAANPQQSQQQQQQLQSQSQATGKQSLPVLVVGRPKTAGQAPVPMGPSPSVSTFQSVMSGALSQELNRLGPTIDDSNKLDIPGPQQRQQPVPMPVSGRALSRWPAASSPHSNRRRTRRNHNPSSFAAFWNPPRAESRFRAMGGAGPNHVAELLQHNGHSHPATMLSQALAKVGNSSKKLVLGEVTPPPSAVDNQRTGIKEALQEITSYDSTDLLAIWRGILPGTNWCGMGDRATSYNDLGFESDIDICCRAHDFCPIRLSAFSAGYGLFNWSFYTRSHCNCDQNFLNCLQRAESPLASVVMRLYFTIMKTTCLHDNETSSSFGSQRMSPQDQNNGSSNSNNNNKSPIHIHISSHSSINNKHHQTSTRHQSNLNSNRKQQH